MLALLALTLLAAPPARPSPDEIKALEARCCDLARRGAADEAACERLWALGKAPRALDEAPRVSAAAKPLPAGEVKARFSLNTGGDQMACRPVQAGLVVIVEVADTIYALQFASCDEAGFGSAITTPGMLSTAECDGRVYDLTRRGGAIVVLEGQAEVARVPIK